MAHSRITVSVGVTQRHIDEAARTECTFCPIELALIAAGYRKPTVGHAAITAYDAHGVRVATSDVPGAVSWFIADFDSGRAVRPFRFTVEFDLGWEAW